MFFTILDTDNKTQVVRLADVFNFEIATGILWTDQINDDGDNIFYCVHEDAREGLLEFLISQTPPPTNSNGEIPDDPTADYADPLCATRLGYRVLEFMDDKYKTHKVKLDASGNPRYKINASGNKEYQVEHKGDIYYKGNVVYVWHYGFPTQTAQHSYEVLAKPGYVICCRANKVKWKLDDGIKYWLPK